MWWIYTPALCTASMVTYRAVTDVTSKFLGWTASPQHQHRDGYWLICALWRSLRDCSKLPEKVRRLDGVEILACSSQVKLSSLWASLRVNYVWLNVLLCLEGKGLVQTLVPSPLHWPNLLIWELSVVGNGRSHGALPWHVTVNKASKNINTSMECNANV